MAIFDKALNYEGNKNTIKKGKEREIASRANAADLAPGDSLASSRITADNPAIESLAVRITKAKPSQTSMQPLSCTGPYCMQPPAKPPA